MKQILLFLLFALPFGLLAQNKNITLEGAVADSSGIGLPSASLVLLQQSDSVMHTFGLSGPEGRFAIKRVTPGDYITRHTIRQ